MGKEKNRIFKEFCRIKGYDEKDKGRDDEYFEWNDSMRENYRKMKAYYGGKSSKINEDDFIRWLKRKPQETH